MTVGINSYYISYGPVLAITKLSGDSRPSYVINIAEQKKLIA